MSLKIGHSSSPTGPRVTGPSFGSNALSIGAAGRRPRVAGPRFPGSAQKIKAELYRYPDLSTKVADLDLSMQRRWQEQLSQPGSGSFLLMRDDPNRLLIDVNSLVRFSLFGHPAFVMLVESGDLRALDAAGKKAQLETFGGRGWQALLEYGEIDPSRGVGSQPNQTNRAFGWQSIAYNRSTWIPPAVLGSVGDMIDNYRFINPFHPTLQDVSDSFHDHTASCLWAPGGTFLHGRPQPSEQGGNCWFVQDEISVQKKYWFEFLSDDAAELYIDEQLVLSRTGQFSGQASRIAVDFTAGPHLIAMHVLNSPDAEAPFTLGDGYKWNPGWGAWAQYDADPTTGGANMVAHSDGSGKMLAYVDSPPGMTPGEVLLILIREMQARGVLTNLEVSFSELFDSNGNAWSRFTDIATRVFTDFGTFVSELAQTYIDARMDLSRFRLHAYRKGEMGVDRRATVAYYLPTSRAASSGNLHGLSHRRSFGVTTALRFEYAGGSGERVNTTGAARYGRIEGELALGAQPTLSAADSIADAQLATIAVPQGEITLELRVADDVPLPWRNTGIGDTVTDPGIDLAPVPDRIVANTVIEDEKGNVAVSTTTRGQILSAASAQAIAEKKMIPGAQVGT